MTSDFIDTKQAAEILNLSPFTLRDWRVAGGGPPYRKFGRKVLYAKDDLKAWADRQTRKSTAGFAK